MTIREAQFNSIPTFVGPIIEPTIYCYEPPGPPALTEHRA